MGNPTPVFLSRTVHVVSSRNIGVSGTHLRLKLKHGDSIWDAVAFGMGERSGEVQGALDIVYNLELDEWNGESKLRLNIIDFAPAKTNPSVKETD
jgi:single-stranded-DNA-specific exonuclease